MSLRFCAAVFLFFLCQDGQSRIQKHEKMRQMTEDMFQYFPLIDKPHLIEYQIFYIIRWCFNRQCNDSLTFRVLHTRLGLRQGELSRILKRVHLNPTESTGRPRYQISNSFAIYGVKMVIFWAVFKFNVQCKCVHFINSYFQIQNFQIFPLKY